MSLWIAACPLPASSNVNASASMGAAIGEDYAKLSGGTRYPEITIHATLVEDERSAARTRI